MTYPRNATVHQLFEHQALRTPNAAALVVSGDAPGEVGTLTYERLDGRASAIATRLRAEGVKAGDLVGLMMGRTSEMIAAMIGILKAGGAYVPLDPSYPQERLDFMMADTGARVCLTEKLFSDRAQWPGSNVIILNGSDVAGSVGAVSSGAPEPVTAESPAYVMYTSGSTGQPKGVVIPHRAILRLVMGSSFARLDHTRVILQLAPTAFDAATFEIWGALLHGGRCVLAPDTGIPDLARLRQVIVETGVTTMWLTATLFNTIVDQAPSTLETVEEVLTGGEALSVPHVRRALEALPSVRLINGYGPTESTTFACCYRIPRPLPADCRSIPIGPPIANTTVFLLDDRRQPVPNGEPGDLYIGGDGLALGYLNRPELTAERFVPDPFAGNGRRLYRTGDRARMLPDGALEFLGRLDDQVKIHGHRVELGEIEIALARHPGVGSAVVMLREDVPGDKRLVAYCAPRDPADAPSPAQLRSHLEARLPEHMVPSLFVEVTSIPMTANGKADRRALPAPGRRRPALDRPMVPPRTLVEAWVARLWREILDLDEVGVQDRFFDLGGTSLSAMHLLGRLCQETGATIPVLLLFRAPTVADMSAILEREHGDVLPAPVAVTVKGEPPDDTGIGARDARRRDELEARRQRRRHGT